MKYFNRLTAFAVSSATAAMLLMGASALPAAAQQADPVYAVPAPQLGVDPNYAQQPVVAAIPGCPFPLISCATFCPAGTALTVCIARSTSSASRSTCTATALPRRPLPRSSTISRPAST